MFYEPSAYGKIETRDVWGRGFGTQAPFPQDVILNAVFSGEVPEISQTVDPVETRS